MNVNITSPPGSPFGYGIIAIQDNKVLVNGDVVGVTKDHFNALLDEHDKYKQMLVNAGLLAQELTQEEKLEKAMETIERTSKINQALLERLEALENKYEIPQNADGDAAPSGAGSKPDKRSKRAKVLVKHPAGVADDAGTGDAGN